MLRSLSELEHCQVSATDGRIGILQNFLLDDERWILRYLVVETSGFSDREQILISPISFRQIDWSEKQLVLDLTEDKLKNSPNIDTKKPISRQQELGYSGYFGYCGYWGDLGLWGGSDYPGSLAEHRWTEGPTQNTEHSTDIHLRNANTIRGFQVQGSDASIGSIEDFIVDDQTWEIRFLVLDASGWWPHERVLVDPHWATRIEWDKSKVYVTLSRQLVKSCPKWNSASKVNQDYEARLYDYYGRTIRRDHMTTH